MQHPRAGRVAFFVVASLGSVAAGSGCALVSLDGLTGGVASADGGVSSSGAGATGDDSGGDPPDAWRATGSGSGGGSGVDAGAQGEAASGVDSSSAADSSPAVDASGAVDSSPGVDASPPPPPTCSTGQIACGGVCVDPTSDPNNCNGCGNVCPSGLCGASIRASMAGQPGRWSFNGTAQYDGTQKSAVMTAADVLFQAGTVVYEDPVAFDAFVAGFEFRMGYGGGTRSDGMGFMFQTNGPNAVAGNGGALAMTGLAGYGVELDIYDNAACGDVSDDHVGVDSLASCSANAGQPQSLDSTDVSSLLDLADGNWHTATVSLSAGAVSVVVDDVGVIKGVTLPGYVPNTPAYLGFAGATGGLVDSSGHGGYRSEVRNVSITFPSPRCL